MNSRDVIQRLYTAFGKGDLPGVLALLDPNVDWREAQSSPYQRSGEGWVGLDAVVANLFEPMAAHWAEFVVHPRVFHDSGDVVTVEGRYSATHNETGRALDCQFCHVWTVKDGLITKFQQYMDTARFQHAMGVTHT